MLTSPKLPKKSLTKIKTIIPNTMFFLLLLLIIRTKLYSFIFIKHLLPRIEVKYYILSIFYSFWTRKMRKENPKYQKEKCLKMKWIASHLTMTFSGWTRTSKNSRRRRSSSIHVVILKKKIKDEQKKLKTFNSWRNDPYQHNNNNNNRKRKRRRRRKIPGNISEMMMELKAINFSFLFFFILIPTTIFIQTHTFFIETKWNDLVEQNIVVLVGWLVGWWNEIEQFLLKIHFQKKRKKNRNMKKSETWMFFPWLSPDFSREKAEIKEKRKEKKLLKLFKITNDPFFIIIESQNKIWIFQRVFFGCCSNGLPFSFFLI